VEIHNFMLVQFFSKCLIFQCDANRLVIRIIKKDKASPAARNVLYVKTSDLCHYWNDFHQEYTSDVYML
jgi:hypothetical protein